MSDVLPVVVKLRPFTIFLPVRQLLGRLFGSTLKFCYFSPLGVANRGCSIRVPRGVAEERKGYLEDRRPASNSDPYQVTEVVVRTTCLDQ